ncbi:unnamed protein product [Protopolystoma xenopodis]|uniref:Uncharacterized protein n=1 Tax=Protopolystoma xenopodis TaxID=117903 RepID=A0A448X6J0_9PLAT|nr:unnamed protein product [Protopolystoma xenopodis]
MNKTSCPDDVHHNYRIPPSRSVKLNKKHAKMGRKMAYLPAWIPSYRHSRSIRFSPRLRLFVSPPIRHYLAEKFRSLGLARITEGKECTVVYTLYCIAAC